MSRGWTVSQERWEASRPRGCDKVAVRNLHATAMTDYEAWARTGKAQPLLISVILSLGKPAYQAASKDSIDHSTVHYGKLSKAISSQVEPFKEKHVSGPDLISIVEKAAIQVAGGGDMLAALEIELFFPKASAAGAGHGHYYSRNMYTGDVSTVQHMKDIQIPVMIGVNSNERQWKQSVVINAWVDGLEQGEAMSPLSKMEYGIVQDVEKTEYDTLEALTSRLAAYFFVPKRIKQGPESGVRVRVEKPIAVVFADSPYVEIYRLLTGRNPLGEKKDDDASMGD